MELLNREIEYELSKAGITTYNEVLQNAPLNENPISPNKLMVYSIFLRNWSFYLNNYNFIKLSYT
jgi:hypothetical protein